MKQLLRRAKTQHLYAVPSTNLGLRFVPAATLQYYPRAKIESLVVVVVVKLGKDTLVKFFFHPKSTCDSTTTTTLYLLIYLLRLLPPRFEYSSSNRLQQQSFHPYFYSPNNNFSLFAVALDNTIRRSGEARGQKPPAYG